MEEEDRMSFMIGRKGIVFLVRENGSTLKCGFRINEGHIEVFDRRTSTWHVMPELLTRRNGGAITVTVMEEYA